MATRVEADVGAKIARTLRDTSAPEPGSIRNVALDAYRGFVMLLMMAEVLRVSSVAASYPRSAFWKFLAFNQTHVEWFGCSLHDTIQPGFSFLVGVSIPYSLASRMAKGAQFAELFAHALWRSLVLVALGVFLRSMDRPITYFTFEDTLSQIGLGYPLLFLIAYYSERPERIKSSWVALAVILVGYWLLWPCIPRRLGISTGAAWEFHQSGMRSTTSVDSPRTGTKISILETASTNGFSIYSPAKAGLCTTRAGHAGHDDSRVDRRVVDP